MSTFIRNLKPPSPLKIQRWTVILYDETGRVIARQTLQPMMHVEARTEASRRMDNNSQAASFHLEPLNP